MRHIVEHTSPESLWATLENFLNAAIAMFGDAAALIERALIGRREHRAACAWLARCEHLLRRLIFIDAAQLMASLAPAAKPQPRSHRAGAASARQGAAFALILTPRRGAKGGAGGLYKKQLEQVDEFVDPDAARARAAELAALRRELFPRPPTPPNPPRLRGQGATPEQAVAPAYLSTRGLAMRFDALVAAARARQRCAGRLARRLNRDRALARCFTLPPRASFRPRPVPGDFAVADAAHFADRAWAVACDTS